MIKTTTTCIALVFVKCSGFLTGQNILKISEHYHKLSKAVSNHKTNLKCMQRRSSACGVVVGGLLVVHRGA